MTVILTVKCCAVVRWWLGRRVGRSADWNPVSVLCSIMSLSPATCTPGVPHHPATVTTVGIISDHRILSDTSYFLSLLTSQLSQSRTFLPPPPA